RAAATLSLAALGWALTADVLSVNLLAIIVATAALAALATPAWLRDGFIGVGAVAAIGLTAAATATLEAGHGTVGFSVSAVGAAFLVLASVVPRRGRELDVLK